MSKLCENVIKEFEKENISGAFDITKPHSNISSNQTDQLVVTIIQQWSAAKNVYGKMLGHTLIKKETVKNVFIKYLYVVRCEKIPVRFEFIFYNSLNDWKIINMKWDDDIKSFF